MYQGVYIKQCESGSIKSSGKRDHSWLARMMRQTDANSGAHVLTHQPQSLSLQCRHSGLSPWPDIPAKGQTKLLMHEDPRHGAVCVCFIADLLQFDSR